MEREIILHHIRNVKENHLVDYKREFYTSLKNSEIAKDVAAFANLTIKEDKYIIFGVEDATHEIVGIDAESMAKQDDIDAYLESKLEPFLSVESGMIQTDDEKYVGYIKIPYKHLNPPYVIKEICGKNNRIEKGDIFIRKGTCNKKATRSDIDEIYMKNGELKIRIHDEITIVEPIEMKDDLIKNPTYGHIDVEIFNDTTRPLLISGGEILIERNICGVRRPIWSVLPAKNIRDYPLEVPAQSRKVYTMLYDFLSQDCVDFEFDGDGHIDEAVKVKVFLADTDENIYESSESKVMMLARGDVLHKVWFREDHRNMQPSFLRKIICKFIHNK